MKKYKKFCTRALPVYAAQYWYIGDTISLPVLTDEVVKLDPFFVHSKDSGVSVYYESHIIDEGANHLFEYYRDNPHKLKALTKEYRKIAKGSAAFLESATKENMQAIFDLNAEFVFPFTTIIYQLGNQERQDLKEVAMLARRTRHWDDKVIYGPGFKLYDLMQEKFTLPIDEWPAYVTIEEATGCKQPSIDEITRRQQNWIYIDGEIHANVQDVTRFLQTRGIRIEEDDIDTEVDQFTGITAYKGKSVGRVRIVRTFKDMEVFQDGEIMVSPMTSPDFMPAIVKATAIVTDEGGATCHAAIVARELKIPSIMGTKVATQILKDNDLIEVNANGGLVRIIERD